MDKVNDITEATPDSQSAENKSAVNISNEKNIWNSVSWIIINFIGST